MTTADDLGSRCTFGTTWCCASGCMLRYLTREGIISLPNASHIPEKTRYMREYTGPTAATVASRLPGGTGRPDSAGRYRVRGFCHGHGNKRDSTSLSIQDRDQGGLLVTCFVGCDRQTIIAALERATGLTIWQAWTPTGATQGRFSRLAGVAPEPRKQRQRRLMTEDTDRIQMARGLWQSAVTVRAKETDHPAWHWLNARNLWRPEFPLPSCLRWLPASAHWSGRGQHTGAGSIVALVAPPWAWAEAWPGLPEPQAVELIAIKSNGTPALDRPATAEASASVPWDQDRRRRGFRLPRSDPGHGTGASC